MTATCAENARKVQISAGSQNCANDRVGRQDTGRATIALLDRMFRDDSGNSPLHAVSGQPTCTQSATVLPRLYSDFWRQMYSFPNLHQFLSNVTAASKTTSRGQPEYAALSNRRGVAEACFRDPKQVHGKPIFEFQGSLSTQN